jgi:DNA-binding Lrp family transcriptional regulator
VNSTDARLLALLRENARISTSELARKLGLSRSTVHGRIRRLEQTGVIAGYTLEYGSDYGQRLVSAQVLIQTHQKLTARTNRELHAIPEIRSLHAISGDYDLIAMVQAETTEALSRVLDEIGNLEGVERTSSSVILETKFSR